MKLDSEFSEWQILNGTADYRLEGNEIVGTSKANTPNTFLTTKDLYSDFILEFDVKADPLLNSGVQIRSNSLEDYQEGRVHGYQVEIESSDRKWAGGIYDEGRRGWLYSLDKNPAGQSAFKVGEWNTYRIEAIGPEIKTWINGIPCSYLVDDMTDTGFIGLQVHSIKDQEQIGKEIRWRNLAIRTKNLERYRNKDQTQAPKLDLRETNKKDNP